MMMKKYNFKKARKIINVLADELVRADMGIVSDWYSTSETVWSKEDGFLVNLSRAKELGGLEGSYRGIPTLELSFKDGSVITFECYLREER